MLGFLTWNRRPEVLYFLFKDLAVSFSGSLVEQEEEKGVRISGEEMHQEVYRASTSKGTQGAKIGGHR